MQVRGFRTCSALAIALGCSALVPIACRDFTGDKVTGIGGSGGGTAGTMAEPTAGNDAAGSAAGAPGQSAAGATHSELGGAGGARSGEGDAGEAGAAGAAGAPERSPDSFPGLALWLEAKPELCAADENHRVAHCADQSKYGNDANQFEVSSQPVLADSRVNGLAALHFSPDLSPTDATYLTVDDDKSLQFGTDDFAYVLVASWKNSADKDGPYYYGYGRLVSKQLQLDPYRGLTLLANYPAGINEEGPLSTRLAAQVDTTGTFALSNSFGLNNDEFRLCVARRVGDSLELRINGQAEGKVSMQVGTDLSQPGAAVLIGGSASEALSGDIAELVVIHGQTSLDELTALERHFLTKYGVSATPAKL